MAGGGLALRGESLPPPAGSSPSKEVGFVAMKLYLGKLFDRTCHGSGAGGGGGGE